LKKVLIIANTFPPAPGIGGRRWAKFAKYLHRQGVDVHVICGSTEYAEKSSWTSDISDYKDKVKVLDNRYSKYLGIQPKSLLEKLQYRLSLIKVKLLLKGNYYDKSGFWKKDLIFEVEKQIGLGFNNIIVTCAPFRSAFFLCDLKKKYPEVNFIVDFRDPWTTNRTAYGFASLSIERQEFERKAEQEVVNNFDHVLSVAEDMTCYFKSICSNSSTKFLTINNGFDKDDFPKYNESGEQTGQLNFVFTGTFYNNAFYLFELFCKALSEIRVESESIYQELSFTFYGDIPANVKELARHHPVITIHNKVELKKVYEVISGTAVCMLFLTDDLTFSLSTKFYEYLSMKKSIAVFSRGGKTPDFIIENGLGYSLTPKNIKKELLCIHDHYSSGKLLHNPEFDISRFDVETLTKSVLNILK
jgi:glycosyltransferase involved in cell wall biosynthesis